MAGVAFGPDIAAMGLDDVLHDRETEAGSALVAGTGGVHTEEAFEDPFQGVARDAGSVVRHPDLRPGPVGVWIRGGADRDLAALAAIFDSVVDEIEEDLLKTVGVGVGLEVGGDRVAQDHGAVRGAGGEVVQDVLSEGMEVGAAAVDDRAAGFELGDGEEVVDEEGQSVGVLFDGAEEAPGDGGVGVGAVDEGFHVPFDEGEGCAEFVADVRDEFAAGAFESLESADVVEGEDGPMPWGARLSEGGGVDLEDGGGESRGVELELEVLGLAGGEDPGGQFGELMAADHLQHASAGHGRLRLEQAEGGGVDQADPSIPTEEDESVRHGVEDVLPGGLVTLAFCEQFVFALGEAGESGAEVGGETSVPAPPPDIGEGQGEDGEDGGGGVQDSVLHEAVANAPDGVEVAGGAAQLFAEPPHVGVHGAGVDDVVVLPDILEQLFAGLDPTAPLHEGGE